MTLSLPREEVQLGPYVPPGTQAQGLCKTFYTSVQGAPPGAISLTPPLPTPAVASHLLGQHFWEDPCPLHNQSNRVGTCPDTYTASKIPISMHTHMMHVCTHTSSLPSRVSCASLQGQPSLASATSSLGPAHTPGFAGFRSPSCCAKITVSQMAGTGESQELEGWPRSDAVSLPHSTAAQS